MMAIATPLPVGSRSPHRSAAGVLPREGSRARVELEPVRLRRVRSGPNGVGRYGLAALAGFGVAFAVMFAPSIGAQASHSDSLAETAAIEVVEVGAGDSLWSIAASRMPGVDPREGIARLQQENGLTGTEVVPGQRLVVPVS